MPSSLGRARRRVNAAAVTSGVGGSITPRVQLQLHTTIEVGATPERVFDFLSAPDVFVRVLRPLGPIPGGASSELLDGATTLAPGVRRRVGLTDGTSLEEQVLDHDRPRRQRYRWGHAPQGPFGLIIRGAEADWRLTSSGPSGQGTRIDWDYAFELSSPLVAPLGWLVLRLFERFMQRGLVEVQKAVAGGAA